jgi:hypothetical protein
MSSINFPCQIKQRKMRTAVFFQLIKSIEKL